MSWELEIARKGNDLLFTKAWEKAQWLRQRVTDLTEHFFKELIEAGVDVEGPPNLGDYTPYWEPLDENWLIRKGDSGFFYGLGTGGHLETTLLGKTTVNIFGLPQVFLEWNGGSRKINAGEIALHFEGDKLSGLSIRVLPFPRLEKFEDADELVTGGKDTAAYGKLTNYGHGGIVRPLITPFLTWYVRVKITNAIRGFLK